MKRYKGLPIAAGIIAAVVGLGVLATPGAASAAVPAARRHHGATTAHRGHAYAYGRHHGKGRPAPVRTGTAAPASPWDSIEPTDYPACAGPDASGPVPCYWAGSADMPAFYVDPTGVVCFPNGNAPVGAPVYAPGYEP